MGRSTRTLYCGLSAMRSSLTAALVCVVAQASLGQTATRTTLVVRDATGVPVSWAMVRVAGSAPQIADDSGRMRVAAVEGDSIQVSVRRMGYRPFDGWVHRSAQDGTYSTILPRLALALDTVRARPPRSRHRWRARGSTTASPACGEVPSTQNSSRRKSSMSVIRVSSRRSSPVDDTRQSRRWVLRGAKYRPCSVGGGAP